jgi:hypothetical protein
VILGVLLGVTVVVGVAVGVAVGVEVAVGVAVADGLPVAVGVGDGGGPDCAQYLPPVLVDSRLTAIAPPHTIISLPSHTAV